MKKNVCYLFSLMAICLFSFSACSLGSSSPGEAAKKYTGYLKSGNYEKFVDCIAVGEDTSEEEAKAGKAMFVAMMDKVKKSIEAKGGIKDIEVISETIAEDGKSAEVVLKMTYNDGTVSEDDMDMVMENGKWKMSIKK